MLPNMSAIIRDPSRGKESDRKIMDGVIHSGVLNTFQTKAVDGLVQSGIPEHKRGKHDSGKAPLTHKSKKPATPYSPGFVHYPGSQF
jgi:hypothetical protein